MPFGNSVLATSEDFEMQRRFHRCILQEPPPLGHGSAHGSRTRARSPRRGHAVAHARVAALEDLLRLSGAQQALAQLQRQPHGFDEFEDVDNAHAQHREVAGRRLRAFDRELGLASTSAAISWAAVSGVWLCSTSVLRRCHVNSR